MTNDLINDGKPKTGLTIVLKGNVKTHTPTPYTREQLLDMTKLDDPLPIFEFLSVSNDDYPPELIRVRRSEIVMVVIQELKPESQIIRAVPAMPPGVKLQ